MFCYELLYSPLSSSSVFPVPVFNFVTCVFPVIFFLVIFYIKFRQLRLQALYQGPKIISEAPKDVQRSLLLPQYYRLLEYLCVVDVLQIFLLFFAQSVKNEPYKVFWIFYRDIYRATQMGVVAFFWQQFVPVRIPYFKTGRIIGICLFAVTVGGLPLLGQLGLYFGCNDFVPQADVTYAKVESYDQIKDIANQCHTLLFWFIRDCYEVLFFLLVCVLAATRISFFKHTRRAVYLYSGYMILTAVGRLVAGVLLYYDQDSCWCFLGISYFSEATIYVIALYLILQMDSKDVLTAAHSILMESLPFIQDNDGMDTDFDGEENVISIGGFIRESDRKLIKKKISKHFFIPFDQLETRSVIGSGGSSRVYLGLYAGAEVAIKQVSPGEGVDNMFREINVLMRIHHPNIVRLYGVSKEGNYFYLVEEFCPYSLGFIVTKKEERLKEKINLRTTILKICQGMAYLHSRGIIHRDLKNDNILLDRSLNVKICDFGLSRKDSSTLMTTAIGTPVFMAPELMKAEDQKYDNKVDVYSFAIVLWSLLAEEYPFGAYKWAWRISDAVISGNRPEIKPEWSRSYVNIITQCWAEDPHDRPSFAEIVELLNEAEEDEGLEQERNTKTKKEKEKEKEKGNKEGRNIQDDEDSYI